jgi:hypothetical protein
VSEELLQGAYASGGSAKPDNQKFFTRAVMLARRVEQVCIIKGLAHGQNPLA